MATTPQKEALAANVTWCTGDPIIKVTARDGEVAAYAPHTRYLDIGGTLYSPYYPVDAARPSTRVGLQPDSGEFRAPFDDIITKADVLGGRWRGARAYTAFVVDYRNVVTLGVVQERTWLVGRIKPRGSMFTMELLGRTQALSQPIGEVTAPIDRHRTPEELGVNIASFTHAATVTTVTDRRIFTTGVSQADVGGVPYFRYGRAIWLTGANAGTPGMEIEDNDGAEITLQLPMRSDIEVGDTLELIAGYDGTLEQARDKFDMAINFNGEPHLPGMMRFLTYPE
jgi:uncharacterized phage protein (TIGR02218 family)